MAWWNDPFGRKRIAELERRNGELADKARELDKAIDLARTRGGQNVQGAEVKFQLVKQTNRDLRETMKRAVLALDAVTAAHVLPNEAGSEIGRVADGLRDFTDLPGRSYTGRSYNTTPAT